MPARPSSSAARESRRPLLRNSPRLRNLRPGNATARRKSPTRAKSTRIRPGSRRRSAPRLRPGWSSARSQSTASAASATSRILATVRSRRRRGADGSGPRGAGIGFSAPPPQDDQCRDSQDDRCGPREEVPLRRLEPRRHRSPHPVLLPGREEVRPPARKGLDLGEAAPEPVEPGRRAVALREWKKWKRGHARRDGRSSDAPPPLGHVAEPGPCQRHGDEESREERVVNVGQRVPTEGDGEEHEIAASTRLQIAEEEEKRQAEERPPLELQVRDLLHAPRKKGVHDAGGRRGERISRHVPGERPGRKRGEEHSEQEKDVVIEHRRRPRGEQREAEKRHAVEVFREREDVARGVEEVQLEELARIPHGLREVPVKDARIELCVAEVGEGVAHVSRLRPGRDHGPAQEEERRERRLPPGPGSPIQRSRERALLAIVSACWSRCIRRWRFCVASTSPVGGTLARISRMSLSASNPKV